MGKGRPKTGVETSTLINFRLPISLYGKLKERAYVEGFTVGGILKSLIANYLNEDLNGDLHNNGNDLHK